MIFVKISKQIYDESDCYKFLFNCAKSIVLLQSKFNFDLFLIFIIAQKQCKNGNKTYYIGETYITLDCKERCICNLINGTTEAKCSSLCRDPVDPLCNASTQQIEQQSLGGNNCSCPAKRCIPGSKLVTKSHAQISLKWILVTFSKFSERRLC